MARIIRYSCRQFTKADVAFYKGRRPPRFDDDRRIIRFSESAGSDYGHGDIGGDTIKTVEDLVAATYSSYAPGGQHSVYPVPSDDWMAEHSTDKLRGGPNGPPIEPK